MNYIIYVAENCHQCQEVLDGIREQEIEIKVSNIDKGGEKPPIDVFAFPSLFKGEVLLRYGSDILEYFKNKT